MEMHKENSGVKYTRYSFCITILATALCAVATWLYGPDRIWFALFGGEISFAAIPNIENFAQKHFQPPRYLYSAENYYSTKLGMAEAVCNTDLTYLRQPVLACLSSPHETNEIDRLNSALKVFVATTAQSDVQQFALRGFADEMETLLAALQNRLEPIPAISFVGQTRVKSGTSTEVTFTLYTTSAVPALGAISIKSNLTYLAKTDFRPLNFDAQLATGLDGPRPFSTTNNASWRYVISPKKDCLGEQPTRANIYIKPQGDTNDFKNAIDLRVELDIRDPLGLPAWVRHGALPVATFVIGAIVTVVVGRVFGGKDSDKEDTDRKEDGRKSNSAMPVNQAAGKEKLVRQAQPHNRKKKPKR